ncbi:6-phospho-beta-galactosidase [bioreactor metagenome]|uniref:6-phospho-beta-galactosidase n=1 Tax=bioreactor metagenome TaxID=1076179 RepID=A0A645HBC1_9ZZZZ
MNKAIREGVPVERYYYWSQMDNFEWTEGESAKFGLYRCNFDTQERTARKSAGLYARLCRDKELTQQMIDEFSITGSPNLQSKL